MTEVKAVRSTIRLFLDDLRNRRRYWKLKEEAENKKDGNNSISIEHKEEIRIFY